LHGLHSLPHGKGGDTSRFPISTFTMIYIYFSLDLYLLFPFPKDLPSNPGRDLPFKPLCFSLLFSFLLAILSARFCCRAAILAASCSFLSVLYKYQYSFRYMNGGKPYHAFLLFVFSFSCRLAAFFRRVSSSRTLMPSIWASAFSHFSRSSICLRFSSGSAASFSFREASCCKA
jgi:hypothetical protein